MLSIALDGPAGAGKSTLAKSISEALGIYYLDTGALYRALAYAVIARGKDPADREQVLSCLSEVDIRVEFENRRQLVFACGEDVTGLIRTPRISKGASDVATLYEVRMKLLEAQREVAQKYDVVMDGRDIGTYVLPNATFKFYVTADSAERAKRRWLELSQKGYDVNVTDIEREIIARDKNDSEREFAPLRRADDAVLVDTTNMDQEQAAKYILDIVRGGK